MPFTEPLSGPFRRPCCREGGSSTWTSLKQALSERRTWVRVALAQIPPFLALGIQWTFWSQISPFIWFLFYPAVFLSAWIGGLAGAVSATLTSIFLAVFCFVEPAFSFPKAGSNHLYSSALFLLMGCLFGMFQHRLAKAKRETLDSLEKTRLANQELERLYAKARELDEAKTRFFSNISHELRTPLTLILGPLGEALKGQDPGRELDPGLRQGLVRAERNAKILLGLVNNLLDVARLEAGHMELRLSASDLAPLLRLECSRFESVALSQGLDFSIRIPGSLPAQVDEEKVVRIVVNLLSNAFKFTPAPGRVVLEAARIGDRVHLEVRDSGPGIPQALRGIIFDRFRQVDDGANRHHGGTGLGLAIVKEFAELHQGEASVAEAPEGGACFRVHLPAVVPEGVRIHPSRSMAPIDVPELLRADGVPSPSPASLGPGAPTVLVVEDNEDMIAFLAEVLGRFYDIRTARSGLEALDMALEFPPDLVLSDVMMPGMTGDRLVEALREYPSLAQVPIVLLTARADDALRVKMLHAGVADYICKPFSTEELVARVGAILEVKGRQKASLQRQENRFQTLFEGILEGVAYCEMRFEGEVPVDFRYLRVNHAFERLTGLREVTGRMVTEVFPGIRELHPELFALYGRVARGGPPERFELHFKPLNSWLHISVYQADPGQFIAVFDNITERKRAEEDLRTREQRLRLATLAGQVGVWDWDLREKQMVWDESMYRLYGLGRDSFAGAYEAWSSTIHPEDKPRVEAEVQAALRGEREYAPEFRIIRSDGEVRIIKAESMTLRDEEGQPIRMIGTNIDITEGRRSEEARRALERQLLQTQKMDSIGSLASGVAHDMNNVLGAILALSDFHLLHSDEGSRLHRDMDIIQKACLRGGKMVRGLLAFARQDLAQELAVDLNAIVREEMVLLERTTLQRVHLEMDLEEGLSLVTGDPGALHNGLMNLCVNAVDAMAEGGRLLVRTRNEADGRVLLAVSDTGQGMTKEVLDRAMEPFFTTKPEGKGTGLGLAVVFGIVKTHGGEIQIQSEPGEGTCISLRFPAMALPASPQAPASLEAPGGTSRALNVLLVDDDDLILASIPALIEVLGHKVTTAQGGEEAIAKIAAGYLPELIILDMNMPGLNGPESLVRIRERLPEVPVLLATGRADKSATDLEATRPRVLVLPKPFELGELEAAMEKVLAG